MSDEDEGVETVEGEDPAAGSKSTSGLRESRADRLRRRREAQRERVDGTDESTSAGATAESAGEESTADGVTPDTPPSDAVGDDRAVGEPSADPNGPEAGTGESAAGSDGVGEAVGSSDADETDATDGAHEADGTDGPTATGGGSVKDEQVGTYMYLPRSQKKEVEHRYTVLKAEFEYAFERDFEKNRHFFPLLVEHGLSGLEGSDADDVREMLQALDH